MLAKQLDRLGLDDELGKIVREGLARLSDKEKAKVASDLTLALDSLEPEIAHLNDLNAALTTAERIVPVPSVRGFVDDSGSLRIKFHLYGVADDPPGPEFEGIFDTGFDGFLQIPTSLALPLRLPLVGTTTFTEASGEEVSRYQAMAMMTLAGSTETVVVSLAPDSEVILVGTQTLRVFRLGLVILGREVRLVDEVQLKRAMDSG